MADFTKEEWKILDHPILPVDMFIVGNNDGQFIASISKQWDNAEANAHLIVATVNACQSVNPDNPQAVAESIKDMYETLKEAKLQIEYLHDKFKVTGTGNTILARIDYILAKAEGREK